MEQVDLSPAGTSSQVVMSLGCDWLRTGPTSDAQVSPVLHASAPSSDRHIQEAEYCFPKSMGISPGPTCNTKTADISMLLHTELNRKLVSWNEKHSHQVRKFKNNFTCSRVCVHLDHVK